jgi:glutamate formiminotransferase / 5-formyltetrahydrofolate cyclo-ligase
LFECVLNLSEGQRLTLLDELSEAAGPSLRDRHNDAVHNRSVFTLINEPDALIHDVHALVTLAMHLLDLEPHAGVHPRFGVVDVVPFVALDAARSDEAKVLRDESAAWIATTFTVPVFLYGPLNDGTTRTLPEIRRGAFRALSPDLGPDEPNIHLGASAVGARSVLVAWNICLRDTSLAEAKEITTQVRGPGVRALAFEVGDVVQVSCNLIDPYNVGPSLVYDNVERLLKSGTIERCELVGLAPEAVVRATDSARWEQLGLSLEATIEARLAQ